MFGGMKQKLQDMQQKMEETKQRLDTITVVGKSAADRIRVTANGNRKITAIEIDEDLDLPKNELTNQLLIATNNALDQAEKVAEAEMQGAAQGILPNLPGLF